MPPLKPLPLFRRRAARRGLAWLLLAAVTLALLAPGVSRALAAARGDATAWGVVCGAGGLVRASAEADASSGGSADGDIAHLLAHCPYCALQTDAIAPPPAPLPAVALPLASQQPPRLFLRAPRPLFAWPAAQPRGPPALD